MPPRDPSHWLHAHSPHAWLRASLRELSQARGAYTRHGGRAGLAGCRRAAGLALNGALATMEAPDARYGRTYMEHLAGLAADDAAPEAAREAARVLLATPLPGGPVVTLRTPATDAGVLEAAETVMGHAYTVVLKAGALEDDAP